MAKEICISSTPHETRLAILEDDQLAEIYYERENEYTLAGSIYNGRVTRVLPGMQSAFVDLGLERDAFLYVTDFLELEDPEESDEIEKAAATGGNQASARSSLLNRDPTAQRSQRSSRASAPSKNRNPAASVPRSQDRQPRDRRLAVEPGAAEASSIVGPEISGTDNLEDQAKRMATRRQALARPPPSPWRSRSGRSGCRSGARREASRDLPRSRPERS